MKLNLDFKIDMLLDAKLKLQLVSNTVSYEPVILWDDPQFRQRTETWDRFYPKAIETPLHFEVNIRDDLISNYPMFIDLERSTLELGYSGNYRPWIGPGKLFTYRLSRYITGTNGLYPINRIV